MARRSDLTKDELKIIKKKVTDEEAFGNFFRDCYLRNLRPATIDGVSIVSWTHFS
ncbi:hypothetical protein [Peribacillus simplex]|uniref:hypothetical protein n=1 Tax=Peribacillus simplex TaxID=1478 RepID=UPI003CF457AF